MKLTGLAAGGFYLHRCKLVQKAYHDAEYQEASRRQYHQYRGAEQVSREVYPPENVPFPRNSLMVAMRVNAAVKPAPMPIPSSAERKTPFLQANISALARMMQFTTIRGMKFPAPCPAKAHTP